MLVCSTPPQLFSDILRHLVSLVVGGNGQLKEHSPEGWKHPDSTPLVHSDDATL